MLLVLTAFNLQVAKNQSTKSSPRPHLYLWIMQDVFLVRESPNLRNEPAISGTVMSLPFESTALKIAMGNFCFA